MPGPTTSFLDALDPAARERLVSIGRPVDFAPGEALVRHGQPATGAYVIREGKVEAEATLPGGERLRLAELGPGDILGEMSLIELGAYTATVRAASAVAGWFVGHEDFRALVALAHPESIRLQHAVTTMLADKIVALNRRVLDCPASEDRPARAFATRDPLAGAGRAATPPFDAWPFLARFAAFERCTPDEIAEIVGHGAWLDLARGACLFHAGGESRAAFVVARGAVEVIAARERRERRIAVLGPGQLVGHLSVLREAPHSTHGFAREAAVLLEIPAERFRALYFGPSRASLRLRGAVQANLLAAMARTNRALTRLICQAQLEAAHGTEMKLEAAYHGQIAAADSEKKVSDTIFTG